jgi:hypothetical protein
MYQVRLVGGFVLSAVQLASRYSPGWYLRIYSLYRDSLTRQIFSSSLLYSWPPGTLPGGTFAYNRLYRDSLKRQIFLFSLLYSWPPGTLPGGTFAYSAFTGIVSQDGYFRTLHCTVGTLGWHPGTLPVGTFAHNSLYRLYRDSLTRQIFPNSLLYSWPPGTLPGGTFAHNSLLQG